ncbi:hypothetical protein PC117_g25339 [Phytophthora cactorum]|uniref:Uncharacterized protein n=1 Tax=Phytophthora cactorum TaxID=29920 RepID=A0A8T1ASS0_9STRA|nr:hypothetical protein PC117_g25339 [Phytophthora cactorum]
MTLANIYPLYKVLYGFVPVQNQVYTRDGRFCCPNRSYDSRFFQRTLRFADIGQSLLEFWDIRVNANTVLRLLRD